MLEIKVNNEKCMLKASGNLEELTQNIGIVILHMVQSITDEEARRQFETVLVAGIINGVMLGENTATMKEIISEAEEMNKGIGFDDTKELWDAIFALAKAKPETIKSMLDNIKEKHEDADK